MTSKILHVPSEVVFGTPLKAEFQEVFGDPHTDPHKAVGRLGYYMDLHWGCCTQIHLFPRSTLRHGQYYHRASRLSKLSEDGRFRIEMMGFTQNKSCLFPQDRGTVYLDLQLPQKSTKCRYILKIPYIDPKMKHSLAVLTSFTVSASPDWKKRLSLG